MIPPRVRALLAAALIACIVPSHHAAAHGVSLDLYHPLAADSAFHRAFLVPWAQKVAKDSGNRINIHIHAASAGASSSKGLYQQAEDNDADLVWAPVQTSAQRFPRLALFETPFLVRTAQGGSRALSEYVRANDLLDRDLNGVRVLAVNVADGAQLHWGKSVAAPSADVAGRRIAVASPLDAALVAALGATPVEMPGDRIAGAVGDGTADGAVLPWERVSPSGLDRVATTHVEVGAGNPGMTSALFVLAMSPGAYRALADDLKAVVDANSGADTAAWLGRVLDEAAAAARTAAAARGDAVRALTAAEREQWMQAGAKVAAARTSAVAQADINVKPLLESLREQLQAFDAAK